MKEIAVYTCSCALVQAEDTGEAYVQMGLRCRGADWIEHKRAFQHKMLEEPTQGLLTFDGDDQVRDADHKPCCPLWGAGDHPEFVPCLCQVCECECRHCHGQGCDACEEREPSLQSRGLDYDHLPCCPLSGALDDEGDSPALSVSCLVACTCKLCECECRHCHGQVNYCLLAAMAVTLAWICGLVMWALTR